MCGWDSLTNSERRVADLVAEGLTNREVGERMFLSRHTVDYHLRHVYQKLNINSRVQLTRLIIEQSRDEGDGPNRHTPQCIRARAWESHRPDLLEPAVTGCDTGRRIGYELAEVGAP